MPPAPRRSNTSVGVPATVTDTVSASLDGDTQTHAHPQRGLADTPPPPDRTALPPESGTRLGEYLLKEKLGEGGSCHVFRGWDLTRLGDVALKILNWANVH